MSLRRMRGREAAEAPESAQRRIPRADVAAELARLLAEAPAEGSEQ